MQAPRGAGRFPLRAGKVLSAEKRQRMEGHFAQHVMKLLLLARFQPAKNPAAAPAAEREAKVALK